MEITGRSARTIVRETAHGWTVSIDRFETGAISGRVLHVPFAVFARGPIDGATYAPGADLGAQHSPGYTVGQWLACAEERIGVERGVRVLRRGSVVR